MIVFRSFGVLICILLFSSTSQAQLEHFGLSGEQINALAIIPNNSWPTPGQLYAASDSNGIFMHDLSSPDSPWNYFGLHGKNIKSLCIQRWGVGPLEAHQLFAGVRPDKMRGDSTFLYQNRFLTDTTWNPADSGLDANLIQEVNAVYAVHYLSQSPPGPVFISAAGKIYRSYEPGIEPWEDIWPQLGPAIINVIKIYPPEEISIADEIIWIGGETDIFGPYLAGSTDYGDNWDFYYPDLSGDNACDAIAIVADYPDTIYAGMEGVVIKTIDGGQNWILTSLQNTSYYFYDIVADPTDPEHVVAGGVSHTGQTALFETHDGGDTWQDLQPPVVAAGVSGMVADVVDNNFIVYIGTFGNGVYRYTIPLVAINDQRSPSVTRDFHLFQNFPNPFNPNTTIEFSLPHAEFVTLKIYNILGGGVATLVSKTLTAGKHKYEWNAGSLTSGIYLYRIQAGYYVQVKKMVLMR
jgi:hypothetical protein